MKKKQWLKAGLWSFSLVLLLFVALVVHIALVTNPKDKPHYGIALARIDFDLPLDTIASAGVLDYIKTQKGVGQVRYNADYHNVVFSYESSVTNVQMVCDQLTGRYPVAARPYKPDPGAIAAVGTCPVVNDKSLLKTLARQIQIHFL